MTNAWNNGRAKNGGRVRNDGRAKNDGRFKNDGRAKYDGQFKNDRLLKNGGRARNDEQFKNDRLLKYDDQSSNNGQSKIEGRNAVLEAFRSGRTVDKLFVLEGCKDGPIQRILKEAREQGTIVSFVSKERLGQLSVTKKHQGVVAVAAAYAYAEMEDILEIAREKGEPPFVILLDGVEDPHNLGAIIRTANVAGAHGVIIPKRRAVGLTEAAVKASAGAVNYTPVAKVTNLSHAISELKEQGLWIVCGDMGGTPMYDLDLKGPLGLVIGGEGGGVSELVKQSCDFAAAIPVHGAIESLNASVAAGVLAYEALRQRRTGGTAVSGGGF